MNQRISKDVFPSKGHSVFHEVILQGSLQEESCDYYPNGGVAVIFRQCLLVGGDDVEKNHQASASISIWCLAVLLSTLTMGETPSADVSNGSTSLVQDVSNETTGETTELEEDVDL